MDVYRWIVRHTDWQTDADNGRTFWHVWRCVKIISWTNNNEENECGCYIGLQVKSRSSPRYFGIVIFTMTFSIIISTLSFSKCQITKILSHQVLAVRLFPARYHIAFNSNSVHKANILPEATTNKAFLAGYCSWVSLLVGYSLLQKITIWIDRHSQGRRIWCRVFCELKVWIQHFSLLHSVKYA